MVYYRNSNKLKTAAVSGSVDIPSPISGAINLGSVEVSFTPWQPSTWPKTPKSFDQDFLDVLKTIFNETIIAEIENVLGDIKKSNSTGLEHRGHVIAIVLLCAIDAIASYAYLGGVGKRYKKFIQNHFPADYRPFAERIYKLHRNSFVHSWNLFEAGVLPGNEDIKVENGTINFGLLNLFDALKAGLNDFLIKIKTDGSLQKTALKRYKELRKTAK